MKGWEGEKERKEGREGREGAEKLSPGIPLVPASLPSSKQSLGLDETCLFHLRWYPEVLKIITARQL